MRLLIKVGGAQLEERTGRADFARAVASARAAGHEVILVHGGGAQLAEMCRAVGIEEVRHEGLRVTCARTSELALAVLGGVVNKTLVRALEAGGVPAVGLTGVDGSGYAARKHAPGGKDLGYVGEIAVVDARLVDVLLAGGFVPVLSSVAPLAADAQGDDAHLYNVNADPAAAALAAALGADALLLLTDVPAVRGADGAALARVDADQVEALVTAGVLAGGMVPKIRAALSALAARPSMTVKVASANGPDAVLRALEEGTGTRIAAVEEEAVRG